MFVKIQVIHTFEKMKTKMSVKWNYTGISTEWSCEFMRRILEIRILFIWSSFSTNSENAQIRLWMLSRYWYRHVPTISLAFSVFLSGYHSVLSGTSHQHRQQGQAEPVSSLGRPTQPCEIDGPCSLMCSGSLRLLCVCLSVCLSFAEWGDSCKTKEWG